MVDALKRYFFQKEYRKVRIDSKKEGAMANGLQSILILTDASYYEPQDIINTIGQFKNKGLKCSGYLLSQHRTIESTPSIEIISKESLHWSGVPKQELLVDWLHDRYDLLIAINPLKNATIDYLMACSNNLLKTSIIFDEQMNQNADFYWQVKGGDRSTLDDYCLTMYAELIKIFGS